MRSRTAFNALPVVFALLACACERSTTVVKPDTARESQLLITIEAVAGRHLSPFGGTRAMPSLEAIAARGTIYDDAMTTTPVARPALVTILTGVSPDHSGVRDNIHDSLPESSSSLADEARKAGFDTAAFVSTPFASYVSGLHRGFELFDGPEESIIGPSQHRPPVVAAGVLADHFTQWLASRAQGKPFFAWIHLADLNGLATPPPGSAGSSVAKSGDPLEDYDKALGTIDEAVGAIVAALKNAPGGDSCGVLISGTHGVYLGEGGRRGDAFWLADETLRIPLVRVARLSDPVPDKPRHDPRPTWLPDVAATLERAFGATVALGQDGVPLEDVAPEGRLRLAWAFAPDDQLAWPPLTAVREGAALSLFSASSDGGLIPVGEVSAAATAAAGSRPALRRRRVLPEASRNALVQAGVKVGNGATHAQPAKDKDADSWLRDLQIARGYLANHRQLLAARLSRKLLQAAPESLPVLQMRLFILLAEPSEELSEIRDTLLALYPNRSEALHWAAHVALLNQDFARAAPLLDAAIAVGPVEPEIYYDRACVHVLSGETKLGLASLETALKVGYKNWDWIDKDSDLASIRSNPEFVELLRTHGR